jgi:hypothetical protein
MRNLNIIIKIYRWRNRSSKHWGAVQAVQSRSAPYNTVTTKPLKCFSFLFSFGSSAICYRWVIFKWLRTIPIWICLAPLPYLHFWSIFFWSKKVEALLINFLLELTSIPPDLQAGLASSLRNLVGLALCASRERVVLLSCHPRFWGCNPEKWNNRQRCLPRRRWEGDHRTPHL